MSKGGNWKGSDTGTRLPSMPKPRGRAGGVARREEPADDTWRCRRVSACRPGDKDTSFLWSLQLLTCER